MRRLFFTEDFLAVLTDLPVTAAYRLFQSLAIEHAKAPML
jgi:hypothetical protein